MVSNERLDLPLPLGPVTTVNFPRGRSTSIPLRLFWRAPRISMQSFAPVIVTRLFFAIFEPTGKIRCQSSGSQILRGARAPRSHRLRAILGKTGGELFTLFQQLLRHNTAERVEKRLVLDEFFLP